ncbi:RNA polymerase sigma factor [Bacillus sp. EB01]|uniref:RNA polymerase sigma factor n=1 Tax=Bacillus sp. EB01 TaxID=1347086 RepID=UPI0009DCEDF6|nr:sigma factor [Bacillus sp. EB01]
MVEDEIKDWFDHYHQTIFKYIFMLTKDYQQSEDLTQETFLNAYKRVSGTKN